MTILDRPIPDSYWVVPGQFLAGEYAGSRDEELTRQRLTRFLDAGFDTFFDLTQAGELVPYEPILYDEALYYFDRTVTYRRFPIRDYSLPTKEQMKDILDFLDTALAAGRKVYLHCWGGVGRTGTTVGCYLVRHGLKGEEALRRLNELYQSAGQNHLFPHSPETEEQRGFVLHWMEE